MPQPGTVVWHVAVWWCRFVTETNNMGHDVMPILDDIKKYGWGWQHWTYKNFACQVTGDHAGFFLTAGCQPCQGGVEACLNRSLPDRYLDIRTFEQINKNINCREYVLEYTRVFPEALAGSSQYFHFDPVSRAATLVWQPRQQHRDTNTVVRVASEWLYPAGYTVSLSPAGTARWEARNSSLVVSLTSTWAGEEVALTITAVSIQ